MTSTETSPDSTGPWHLDAWDVAYDAAFAAVIRTRAAGSFDNGPVYHAAITSGISVAEWKEVGRSACVAAIQSYAERREIILAMGDLLD